jgi:hypothetical protein
MRPDRGHGVSRKMTDQDEGFSPADWGLFAAVVIAVAATVGGVVATAFGRLSIGQLAGFGLVLVGLALVALAVPLLKRPAEFARQSAIEHGWPEHAGSPGFFVVVGAAMIAGALGLWWAAWALIT